MKFGVAAIRNPLGLTAALAAACAAAQPARADDLTFMESMNYAASASGTAQLQAAWQRSGTSGSLAARGTSFTAATVAGSQNIDSGTNLRLSNGLVYRTLPSTVTGDFKLRFKMLNTAYQRFSHVVIMDASGTAGYGVRWDAGNYNTSGGRGTLSLTKLSFSAPWTMQNGGNAATGTTLATGTSNHPSTGYAVTDPAIPTYNTGTFYDLAAFELDWEAATGKITVRQDRQLVLSGTDTAFKSFRRVYLAAGTNGTTALDEVGLVLKSAVAWPAEVDTPYGAQMPFVTLEAENPANAVVGARVQATKGQLGTLPITPAQEASGRGYVELTNAGHYVEFSNAPKANTLVIRHCIPDALVGGGTNATLGLYVNGQRRQSITLSSKYNWLYSGTSSNNDNGQSNTPTAFPHVFWDETRLFITGSVQAGDTIRLQKDAQDTAAFYRIDLIDLEQVDGPLPQPADSLSITSYGANGNDEIDDTTAFNDCMNAARTQGKIMWIPPGKYRLGGSGASATNTSALNGVKVQGAGMWHTEIYYARSGSSTYHFFRLSGTGSSVSDLFIDSLTTTNRSSNAMWPFSNMGWDWSVNNVWMTHSSVGFWVAGFDGKVTNCRVRFTYADGININDGSSYNTSRMLVENNHIRGAGDDSIAILSLENPTLGETHNVTVRNNTTVAPWWGSSLALGGGSNHLIENNALYDGPGFVLNLPGAYPKYPITSAMFRRNLLVRCGRNLASQKRGAIWSNPGYAYISGMTIEGNVILDPTWRGLHCATSLPQQIVFRGNLIDSPGENAIYVNGGSVGTLLMDSNSIRNTGTFAQIRNDAPSTFIITSATTSPYSVWKFGKFSTSDFSSMNTVGNSSDPDGDGRSNLGEYGLATEPKTSDSSTAEPTPRVENNRMVLTYFRPDGRTDLSYDVEWSSDLVTWHPSSAGHVEAAGTSPAPGGTLVTVRTVATTTQAPLQFLRLKIRKL